MILQGIAFVQSWLNGLINDEDGQGLVEYSLLVGFISMVALLAVTAVGIAVVDPFQNAADALP